MQPKTLEKYIMVTKLRAKTCVFWSGINSDIDKIVQQCAICQHEIPVRPWQIVVTDIFNLNRHSYLLIVDYYSKYPFIRKLREFSSKEVIDLTKQIFAEQGVPERLISDNEPHFSSQHFKEFAKAWDFEHITSSPKYPQSNGMAERCIQTIKEAMKKAILSNRDVDMSLLCLRLTPMDHVIPSPGELLFNRKLVSNLPTKCTNNITRKEEIQDCLLDSQWLQGKQHDQHAKDLSKLSTGQLVRVQEQDTRKWTPAVVKHVCTEPRSYIFETPTGQVLRRNRRYLKEDVSNKALTSPHSTSPPHSEPPPPNIPNTPPAGTPNTPSNICTSSKVTLRPAHKTKPSSITPTEKITRSGRVIKPPQKYNL
ncbi:unnamed protein product [Acanthosepion pharaonis]|uniref:Integrase catalytic domain-containing protein n=1 Tax=Acanthosepion pharaonis TaxID=158019 RepID=A0A812CWQ2_ACAPH|nr:unnamed protein product [Sepia pharaonis]